MATRRAVRDEDVGVNGYGVVPYASGERGGVLENPVAEARGVRGAVVLQSTAVDGECGGGGLEVGYCAPVSCFHI